MTRRSTDNRQKKIVAPRGARGGQRPARVTPPRHVPASGRKEPKVPDPTGYSKRDTDS